MFGEVSLKDLNIGGKMVKRCVVAILMSVLFFNAKLTQAQLQTAVPVLLSSSEAEWKHDIAFMQSLVDGWEGRDIALSLQAVEPLKVNRPFTSLDGFLLYRLSDSEKNLSEKQSSKQLLDDVQAMLDTNVVSYAVLAFCNYSEGSLIRSCTAQIYDRKEAKIKYQSQKSFRVPLQNAENWGDILGDKLVEGIHQQKEVQQKQILDDLMSRGKEDEDASLKGFGVLAGLNFRHFKLKDHGRLDQGLAQLGIFHQGSLARQSLGLNYGRNSDNGMTLTSQEISLVAGVSQRALKSLLWMLEGGVDLGQTRVEGRSDQPGRIEAKTAALKIIISGGFMLSENVQLMMNSTVKKVINLKVSTSESFEGDELKGSLVDFGAGLAVSF